jgi:CheY-like chemotaxis protein
MPKLFGATKPVVMLVDADDDTRALYALLLAEMAGAIEEARDGAEAWERALTHTPDLVVAEKRLAGMDGLALVARLRSEPRCRDCAVLMITSDVTPRERERLLDLGVDEVLLKPCDVFDLVSAAQRLTWRAAAIYPDGSARLTTPALRQKKVIRSTPSSQATRRVPWTTPPPGRASTSPSLPSSSATTQPRRAPRSGSSTA